MKKKPTAERWERESAGILSRMSKEAQPLSKSCLWGRAATGDKRRKAKSADEIGGGADKEAKRKVSVKQEVVVGGRRCSSWWRRGERGGGLTSPFKWKTLCSVFGLRHAGSTQSAESRTLQIFEKMKRRRRTRWRLLTSCRGARGRIRQLAGERASERAG